MIFFRFTALSNLLLGSEYFRFGEEFEEEEEQEAIERPVEKDCQGTCIVNMKVIFSAKKSVEHATYFQLV